MSRVRDERGQVTAFVVVIMVALLALGGLVIDGGNALAAKRRAIDEADGAARAGAEILAVPGYRTTGSLAPDPSAARQAALDYLARTGHTGQVTIQGDQVVVTVTIDQPTTLLGIVGIRDLTLTGNGQAHLVHGVTGQEP
jgi:Flp pilus assembly protein TadG